MRRLISALGLLVLAATLAGPVLAQDEYQSQTNGNNAMVCICAPQEYVPPVGAGPTPSWLPSYLWNF